MKCVRIPDKGEIWYNINTRKYYIVRNNTLICPKQTEVNLIPGDIFNLDYMSGTTKYYLSFSVIDVWDRKNGWVLLTKIGPNQYQYLPELKIPCEDELWYCAKTSGYYVFRSGVFVLVYVYICKITHDFLMQSVLAKQSRDIEGKNVLDSIDGWRFVNSDWKKYLLNMCIRNISDPESILFGDSHNV